MPAQRICVYLSSSPGSRPDYADAAREVARVFAAEQRVLVYGGAAVGLMGVLADAAVEAGVLVEGVIPQALVDRERAHRRLAELHVVPDMHARKAKMFALADAFLALPGGFGTYEELFEIVTGLQLGLHAKPLCLLDTCNFWQPLLHFLDHAVTEGVLDPRNRALLHCAPTVPAALSLLDLGTVL